MDEPTPRHYTPAQIAERHAAMVDTIVAAGRFENPLIEQALRAVPRHLFLPMSDIAEAYTDKAITTAWNDERIPVSSSTQPSLMGLMIDQLDLRRGHRVLEIGAATGYNAAILRHIVGDEGRVVTIDIDEDLVASARGNLAAIGYDDVVAITADGSLGYPPEAPFDRILVTVGAPDVPPAWREQLAGDGVLVVPLALVNDYQKSVALAWRDGHLESRSSLDCRFVALRGAHSEETVAPLAIGAVPGIKLHPELDDPASIDPQQVQRLLEGPWVDFTSGVATSTRELAIRLLGRIALRVRHTFWLSIADEALETSDVPGLFTTRDGGRAVYGALAPDGLGVLARAAGSTVDEGTERETFTLAVRAYGANRDPALALLGAIHEWDRSGRGGDDGIRIAVWPAGSEPAHDAGDLVIHKPSSVIVVSPPLATPGE